VQASANFERAGAVTFEPVGERATTLEGSALKKLMPKGRRGLAVFCAFYGKSVRANADSSAKTMATGTGAKRCYSTSPP
jgi:hypothetical protein